MFTLRLNKNQSQKYTKLKRVFLGVSYSLTLQRTPYKVAHTHPHNDDAEELGFELGTFHSTLVAAFCVFPGRNKWN